MQFYLMPYERYTRSDGETAWRVKHLPNEPSVDLALEHTEAAPGWAFVASNVAAPAGHSGIDLGVDVTGRLDAATRQQIVDAIGVRVLSPQDILYATLIDPAPAEGGKHKPRGVQRTPAGTYEVVIGSLTLTWTA